MKCAACAWEPIEEIKLEDRTVHLCPLGCYCLALFNDGTQKEEFTIRINDQPVDVENVTEVIASRRGTETKRYALLRLDGWLVARAEYLIPFGAELKQLPGVLF